MTKKIFEQCYQIEDMLVMLQEYQYSLDDPAKEQFDFKIIISNDVFYIVKDHAAVDVEDVTFSEFVKDCFSSCDNFNDLYDMIADDDRCLMFVSEDTFLIQIKNNGDRALVDWFDLMNYLDNEEIYNEYQRILDDMD